MQEDVLWHALEAFNVGAYIHAARQNGRANLNYSLRSEAAGLHGLIQAHRAQNGRFVSAELATVSELAERVLFSEQFQLHNHGVPRYPSYTNLAVLNWVLRTNERLSLAQVRQRCWTAIQVMLQDLRSFEICSVAGVETYQQVNFDPDSITDRIRRLGRLQQLAQHAEPPPHAEVILDAPPTDWVVYASDATRTLALHYLTALPQTDQHDEVFFLRTIHITECCCWGILAATMAARQYADLGQWPLATARLRDAIKFVSVLIPLFQTFDATMPAEHFEAFRDATGDASAVQSRTFHLMEIHTQGLDERKAAVIVANVPELKDLLSYQHAGFESLRQMMERASATRATGSEAFVEGFHDLGRALIAWGAIHRGIANRKLPPDTADTTGTGGLGKSYLRDRDNLRRMLLARGQRQRADSVRPVVRSTDLRAGVFYPPTSARPVLSRWN